eukprot:7184464-Prorocentrum_lima.AAC.1
MTSSLVGSEMCIRDRTYTTAISSCNRCKRQNMAVELFYPLLGSDLDQLCLLYTSDAADDM